MKDVTDVDFIVREILTQTEPWNSDGLIPERFGSGRLLVLDPPYDPNTDESPHHFLVGMRATITTPDGIAHDMTHERWRRDNTGRIVLFFEGRKANDFALGSRIRFRKESAQQRH